MADPQTTPIFDFNMDNVRGVRDPDEWISFRREHSTIPLALLIKDIQKQAIVAYRKEVGDARKI